MMMSCFIQMLYMSHESCTKLFPLRRIPQHVHNKFIQEAAEKHKVSGAIFVVLLL